MTVLDEGTAGLVRRLARQLSRLERQVHDQGRAQQAADRSVEGGAQGFYDGDDELRGSVGEQPDGSYGVVTYGGPTPAAPSVPLVAQVAGGATITWDGFDVNDEQAWPLNMAGVQVYLATSPGEAPSPDTHIGFIAGSDGGALTIAQPYDVTTYCTFVAVTTAGVESVPSEEADVTGGSVVAAPTRTTSIDPPPATTTGYDEGHQWWQIVSGKLEGVWEVTDTEWTTVELVSGQLGYFRDALIEALQVTGLSAVSIDGGSIYIAAGGGTARPQAFSGTALPAGWTAVADTFGGYTAPVPSVVAAGYPAGGVGSVLKVDSGTAGQTAGGATPTVTTDYQVGDFEVLLRYRLAINEDAEFLPSSAVWLEFNDNSAGARHQLDLGYSRASLKDHSLSAAAATPAAGEWVNLRFRKAAGAAALSVWGDGDPEPAQPATVALTSALPAGPVRLRISGSTFLGPSEGQVLWVDKFDVTELATGFRVNPDGTGEWPAIGLRAGDAAWRTIGGAGESTVYQNGWTALAGDGVAFRRSPTGDVTMVGRGVPGSANVAAFTLPAGYRPSRDLTDLITKAQGTGVFSTLDILANGQVIARGTGTSTWVSFTMTFPTV